MLKRKKNRNDIWSVEVEVKGKKLVPADIVQDLKSDDPATKLKAVEITLSALKTRLFLMVEAGVISPLVEALDTDKNSDLQYKAALCLNKICFGSHIDTAAVVDAGAIPKLIPLLALTRPELRELAAVTLGSIAGAGPTIRDKVLGDGALWAMLPLMRPSMPLTLLQAVVGAYKNMCSNQRGKNIVDLYLVFPALSHITELLAEDDKYVLEDACVAVKYLAEGPEQYTDTLLAVPKLTERLAALLDRGTPFLKITILSVFNKMLGGTERQREMCVNAGCTDNIVGLLHCRDKDISKMASEATQKLLLIVPEKFRKLVLHLLEVRRKKGHKHTAASQIKNLMETYQEDDDTETEHLQILQTKSIEQAGNNDIVAILGSKMNSLDMVDKVMNNDVENLGLEMEHLDMVDKLNKHSQSITLRN